MPRKACERYPENNLVTAIPAVMIKRAERV
jgi:hypothetical protein